MKTVVLKTLLAIFVANCFLADINASSGTTAIVAEKTEKKKKEPFDWEKIRPDKLSGNKDMDLYILTCDTMWNKMQTFKDSISFFKLDTVWATDDNGTLYKVVKIQDQDGNPRNFSESLKQGMDIVFTGSNILLSMTNITLLNTGAAMALTDNPLLALKYTKCLKGGLNINKLGCVEVKEIINATKKQMTQTKSMRQSQMEGSTDQAIILPQEEGESPNMDELKKLSEVDLGNSDDQVNTDDLESFDMSELDMSETK